MNCDDILHYQKMIVAPTETDRIMKEIDTIDVMHNDAHTGQSISRYET